MAYLDLGTHKIHYRIDGTEGKPWLTFCNSLGTNMHMWDPQVEALSAHFQILRYDRRGHGKSGVAPGEYTIAELGKDVLALWDALGVKQSHFCGLSIGSMTGMWLGINASSRLNRLALCCIGPKIIIEDDWETRIKAVQDLGLPAMVDDAMDRWFSNRFQANSPETIEKIRGMYLATSLEGFVGCLHALRQADFTSDIGKITVPTLVIAGKDDPVCEVADLKKMADTVQQCSFTAIEGRHICNLESAKAFNDALLAFFNA